MRNKIFKYISAFKNKKVTKHYSFFNKPK